MSGHTKGGFRRSAPHKAARYGAEHPAEAAASFPPAFALRSFWGGRKLDQGRSSGCVAHAGAALIFVALAAAGTPLAFVPSPAGMYADTRCEEQPGTTPLIDSGVAPVDFISAIAREGCRAIKAPTPDGRYSDVWTAADVAGIPDAPSPNVGLRPTLADDEASMATLVPGPQQLAAAATDFGAQVCSAIANLKCGILCGIHATPAFEAWWEARDPARPALSDASGIDPTDDDGHGVAILDYRTEADGSISFWLLTSWGEGGDEGGVWVTEPCLKGLLLEAWRFQVAIAAAAADASKLGAPAPAEMPAPATALEELRAELVAADVALRQALDREQGLITANAQLTAENARLVLLERANGGHGG